MFVQNRTTVRLLCGLLLAILLGTTASAEPRRLVILHTSDIHGYIQEYDRGGLERIAFLVEQYRTLYPDQVVLLDAGDTSVGTPLSGFFHGRPTSEVMAHMGYDAISLGNHEFNWGKDKLFAQIERFGVPVLSANVVSSDGSEPPFAASTVFERNGVRVGVIGVVTPDAKWKTPVSATEGWEFIAPEEAIRETLSDMEEHDLTIALTHIGLPADRKLVEAVPELDVVVSGHTHIPLHRPVFVEGTPIVQPGCYAQYLGVLQLSVDPEQGKVEVLDYRLVSALSAAGNEEGAHAIVERYAEELGPLMKQVITTVTTVIPKGAVPGCWDTATGNLIADIFRTETDADVAFYNRGGIRFDIEPGPLTVEQVHKLIPFDNRVVTLEATGQQLKAVVEQGSIAGHGPLSVSGLTAVIDADGKIDIQVGGTPLDEEATYTVATTDFLSTGGDGMSKFPELKEIDYHGAMRDVIIDSLSKRATLSPPDLHRIRSQK